MKLLKLADTLSLPLETAVAQKYAWLGRTGGGKTYGAQKLAELMLEAGAQVVALDPVGVWAGLRMGPNAFDIVVFGGVHGDFALEVGSGALVAEIIVERGISAVLDISPMIEPDQRRFAAAFATRFFELKKRSPSAVQIFLEECQEFVPQDDKRGAEHMLHAFHRLIKIGRNYGIGVSLISQRPQEVNKKALNQTECLFAFQMTGPQERKAILDWVSTKGAFAANTARTELDMMLPKLPVGRPHVWSPQWLDVSKVVSILEKKTPDVSSTPKAGSRSSRVQKLSKIDVDAIRVAMAETIERADAEDPKKLIAEITKLKKQITQPAPEAPEKLSAADRKRLLKLEAALANHTKSFGQEVAKLSDALDGLRFFADKLHETRTESVVLVQKTRRAPTVEVPRAQRSTRTTSNGSPQGHGARDASIGSSGMSRILIALAQRPQGLTNAQLGARSGLASTSGTFKTYLSKAHTNGWIQYAGSFKQITPQGLKALGAYETLPTGEALKDYWCNTLGGGAARILQVLYAVQGEQLSDKQIGAEVDLEPTSGTFKTYMSKLRTLQLIESERGVGSRASDEFYS